MQALNVIYYIAVFLTIIGGLNWAIVAFKDFDSSLVESVNRLTFKHPTFSKVVYFLVGASALYVLVGNVMLLKNHKTTLPFEYQKQARPTLLMRRQ